MASADQLLAQQASQTMSLMNAIAQNTQREFANREAVQRQELAAGLQVASAIGQDQVRKQQISASRQSMALQMKRFESEEKVRRVEESLLPLRAQAQELQYQTQIMNGTKALVDPFMVEEKAALQSFIMQNPDRANEALSQYNSMIAELTNKSVNDPAFDINTELPQKKKALRDWMTQQTPSIAPSGRLAPLQPTGSLIDSMSQPAAQVRSLSDLAPSTPRASRQLTPEQATAASAAFAALGGDQAMFLREHDPITKAKIDSAIKISMVSGDLPPAEIAQFIPQDKLLEITKVAANRQEAKAIMNQLDSYNDQLSVLSKRKEQGAPVDRMIESIENRMLELSNRHAEIMGYGRSSATGESQQRVQDLVSRISSSIEEATNSFVSQPFPSDGSIPTDEQIAESNRLGREIKPYWIVEALGGSGAAEKYKDLVASGGASKQDIASLIDRASEARILELVRDEEFQKVINSTGVAISENQPMMSNTFGPPRIPVKTEIGEALDVVAPSSNATQARKKEAIKVLKSRLPDIILRYTTE